MWWIGLMGAFGLWVGSVEPCYLSAEQPNSFVPSCQKPVLRLMLTVAMTALFRGWRWAWNKPYRICESLGSGGKGVQQRIVCVGTLIAKNYVTAPLTCFQESPGEGFHKGRDFFAIAGEHNVDDCHQIRKGVLVMGHPQMAEDKFTYNIAYLEVEPFDVDPVNPPVPRLPKSEKFNVKFLTALMNDNAKCQFLRYKSDYDGKDSMKNQLEAVDVTMMSRSRCWDTYCPSGNRGCVPYFWTSDTYVCSAYAQPEKKDKKCKWVNVGAPLVCNGTAVGVLKSCYRERPLMTQGYNKHHLRAIKLYQRVASGEEEVEPNGKEQEEPEFPKDAESSEDLWRLG